MKSTQPDTHLRTSRRGFLAKTGAALVSTGAVSSGFAQSGGARHRRYNLADPKAAPMLASYKKAVKAMLELPPEDPRNWYRNTLVHTLDCPHGNWWFVVWHRAYLGHFEQTCRELSGNPDFALPYWDWTTLPRVPKSFFGDILDPTNPAYIESLKKFRARFEKPVEALWNTFDKAQKDELAQRRFGDDPPITSTKQIWDGITQELFPGRADARSLTEDRPDFDNETSSAVSIATIQNALAPTDFEIFGTGKTDQHSQFAGKAAVGILEGSPHNLVHNNIGGFMEEFMSPVDPIFFMHHSNIDRLWDVWTRKQENLGLPTLPTGVGLAKWSKENFLFFRDKNGDPVSKTRAGDYAKIGEFNYDYQAGSGENVVPKSKAPAELNNKLWTANMMVIPPALRHTASAMVALPEPLLESATQKDGVELFARVTLKPGTDTRGVNFNVLVNPPAESASVNHDDASTAGTFSMFGNHSHGDNPITFLVPLTEAVQDLRKAGRLKSVDDLKVQVVATRRGVALAPVDAGVESISVGSF